MKTALAIAIVLAGCAGMPRYEMRPVQFPSSSATSFAQAQAICEPRAQIGSTQAQQQARAQPYTSPMAASLAGQQAGRAIYNGCLAEYGWRLERVCVQDCR